MNPGEWYKQFGSSMSSTYYELLEIIGEEMLRVEVFEYNEALQKVIRQEVTLFSAKEWMEEVLKNNIYQIPREQVPFIMPV
jgi:hypothetical protein